MNTAISVAQFSQMVGALVGMPVSRPWKGYGSTIIIELGVLREADKGGSQKGESCIAIDWDWRLESDIKVLCGSSNSGPKIVACLAALEHLTVADVFVAGNPLELVVTLSNGCRLRSMAMVAGDPRWHIRLPDDTLLFCEEGSLVSRHGTDTDWLNGPEPGVSEHAEAAATRWGKPVKEPKLGSCLDCWFHVRLDGNYHLLDYGVCSAPQGAFDGRVTHMKSGCAHFTGHR